MKPTMSKTFLWRAAAFILLILVAPALFGYNWYGQEDMSSWHFRLLTGHGTPLLYILVILLMAAIGKRKGWLTAPAGIWISLTLSQLLDDLHSPSYGYPFNAYVGLLGGAIIYALPIGIVTSVIFSMRIHREPGDDDSRHKEIRKPLLPEKVDRAVWAGVLLVGAGIFADIFLLLFSVFSRDWPEYVSPKYMNSVLDRVFLVIFFWIPAALLFGYYLTRPARRERKPPFAGHKAEVRFFRVVLAAFFFHLLVTFPIYSEMANPYRTTREVADSWACRLACVENLKQISSALTMYSDEHEGMFPPIDDTKNNFIFDGNALYPDYLSDIIIVACPGDADYDQETNFRLRAAEHHPASSVGEAHPDCITDMSYCYLGWMVTSDEEAESLFEAYDKLSPEDYDTDVVVPGGRGNGGGNVIHRLRIGAEQFLPESDVDPEFRISEIPIVWEIPTEHPTECNHQYGERPAGGHVLYLDGHVDWIRFGERFPMTKTMARLLEERPRDPIPYCE